MISQLISKVVVDMKTEHDIFKQYEADPGWDIVGFHKKGVVFHHKSPEIETNAIYLPSEEEI